MTNIDRNYMLIALGWLIVGTVFGFWMGATNSLDYKTVHVAMLLPGFVTLAIYGTIYRLWPELKSAGMAAAQYRLAVAAQLLLVIGAWHNLATGAIWIVAPASAGVIVAVSMLLWLFWSRAKAA